MVYTARKQTSVPGASQAVCVPVSHVHLSAGRTGPSLTAQMSLYKSPPTDKGHTTALPPC